MLFANLLISVLVGLVIQFNNVPSVKGLGGIRIVKHDDWKDNILHQSVLNAVVNEYNERVNSLNHYVLYKVDSSTIQLVAGLKYTMELNLMQSGCRKSSGNINSVNLNFCGVSQFQDHAVKCIATVISQPWKEQNGPSVTYLNCTDIDELKLHDNLHYVGYDDRQLPGSLEFYNFLTNYNRPYIHNNREVQFRLDVFKSNMRKAKLMQMLEKGSGKYGVNEFSDMTEEEFRRQKLNPTWDLSKRPETEASIPKSNPPENFDWRSKGAVTEVKNQGSCGSCWAFSTTGNIEGQWFVKKGALVSLSEQELVDCDTVDQACNGGLPSTAYKVIMKLGGLETETKYPYDGEKERCTFKRSDVSVYINGSVAIDKDETKMASWLAANGPISIGINANAMQFYFGGISHPWGFLCNKKSLDHGVLIVGYGVDATRKNEPYWIVKNSWGPSWGRQGYYYVYRGDGTCGLNQMCTSAVVN